MIRSFRRSLVILAALLLRPIAAHALAENNVRVDHFKWMVAHTDHFDIYYDKQDAPLIPRIAHYVEGAWKVVGETFHAPVKARTPFFLYSDHNKFEETNIVPIGEGTGGVTEAFKNRLLIFNDGSEEWLRHVIYHEFTHVEEFSILYAGAFRLVQLVVKSPFYPLWMMEGMSEYGAGDIDETTTSLIIRDAVANKLLPDLQELHGFSHLKPDQVTLGYKTGEVAMHFLAEEYGEDKLHALLVAMREHFDISGALGEVIAGDPNNFDLDRFNFRFREWLSDRLAPDIARAHRPEDYGRLVAEKDNLPQFNDAPAISPDGKTLYYMTDRDGPIRVIGRDIASGREKPLFAIRWQLFENLHSDGRGLSVSPDGRWLAFCGEKEQRDFLFIYDLKRHKLRREKPPFNQIRSAVFSPTDSDRLVCVGMDHGYTDLYLLDRKARFVKRLTNTPQYEASPSFSRDGKRVYFSGETLTEDGDGPAGRDLFSVDIETLETKRVTDLIGNNSEPEELPDGSLLLTRDRDEEGWQGLDLFRLRPGETQPERLTRMVGGAFSPRYVAATNKLYFVAFDHGQRQIYEGKWDLTASSSPTAAAGGGATKSESAAAAPAASTTTAEDISPPRKTRIAGAWPEKIDSPLFRGSATPYRFRGSTDLFIPFFFYSTEGGLAAVYYWQFSDMLGNHVLQQQAQYASGNDFYDVTAVYTYARFRPQFTFGATADRFYRDFDQQDQRTEANGVMAMTYPLDRINSVTLGLGATQRRDVFLDQSEENLLFQDRFAFAGFANDTVTGRYLEPVRGRRISLVYQQGFYAVGGNQQYRSGQIETVQYAPLPRESTFVTRFLYGRSVGDSPQVFRLGGIDRTRALSDSDAHNKQNALLGSAELRLRLAYLNARTKWLFPDFFFKAAYLSLFDDAAYGWDNKEERQMYQLNKTVNSAGVGVFWPTFILQTYRLDFGITYAKQTSDGTNVWYITLGPSF